MSISIDVMNKTCDVEDVIEHCKEVIHKCDDPDIIDMYSDILNKAIARLQALEAE